MDEYELRPKKEDDGDQIYEFHVSGEKKTSVLKAKIIFWATIIGGIAIGTLIFLFFLTLFIYLILPIMLILAIWGLLKQSKFKR